MCSSCLTPVYPVEKIVVNEMVLHFKCFCCKHCRKKLSIHNYSSIHGELYCITHYQQLLKRKGNNDEGFGQSFGLPKNKGESEDIFGKACGKVTHKRNRT
uniref:LIM zinc-binding domain-containing protein n=1 Tax=Gouania willdenowi TaxID=441366 RepID=A0A8C5HS28_GOUWI